MEDQAEGVVTSLNDLLVTGLIGALLSFICLWLFIRQLTMTLIIVASVPLSIAITLAAMYVLGYSLNVLSLMGLLLAVGMLIDNAVVVTESVMQQQQNQQLSRQQQVLTGVNKIALAILAGTLTTAIVFLPNIFGVKVQLTIFLEHVAIAICISLLTSLLIAKTLIPLLLSKIQLKPHSVGQSGLSRYYQRTLTWVLNHPKLSTLFAVLILASTALPLQMVEQDNNEGGDSKRLFINYQLEGRHNIEVVEALVDKMEHYLYANQDKFQIDAVYSYYAPYTAQSTLILKPEHGVEVNQLKEMIKQDWPKFAIAKPQFGWGGNNQGIRLYLLGRSTSELIRLSEQVIPLLRNIEGLTDVNSEFNGAQQEVVIAINRDMSARLNMPLSDIAQNIGLALRGAPLRSYRHDANGEISIELALEKQWQQSLSQLEQLPILKQHGQVYQLSQLAQISIQPRFDSISRTDRQTSLQIGANLDDLTTEAAQEQIEQVMQAINFPPGYRYSLSGSFDRQAQEQQIMLTNMVLALMMIYIVMAALFESLLLPAAIISSIIFSITGVFWGLWLTGTPMTIMAMIGILILMGIVVNNGIVLIDQINQKQPTLANLSESIINICISRLRPVLMTVSTTVLGLLPLALGDNQIAGGGPAYAPMATAIVSGLIFSTLTSLVLVPLCYQSFYRLRHQWGQHLASAQARSQRWLFWT